MSLIEVLLGSFIVIGHNVFRIVPNEVPILVALAFLSIWLRKGKLSDLGFKRPSSWTRIIVIALIAAALRHLIGELVIVPITENFWPEAQGMPEGANEIKGNIKTALLWLLLVWTFAAFGEEISYRGYLVLRTADLGNRSNWSYIIGVVFVSVLFGFGHYYKGPGGMIDSGFAGLLLGATYLISGRNLWTTILAHGFIDTFGVIVLFFGWAE